MLVVTSDHGEEFYDHGSWEHGHSLYNELIKIPLVIKYPGNGKKGVEEALVSFTDIPGIMLKESGLHYDKKEFPVRLGEKNRVLPVLFPHSPIIRQIPPKISFVNDTHHFIYNIIDREKIKIFNPQPRDLQIFELYELGDLKETINIAKKESKAMREFRKLLQKYLHLLDGMEGKTGKLDKNLEKELKSLGYLNDK
jgi:arylsulfatase A-like enzyme